MGSIRLHLPDGTRTEVPATTGAVVIKETVQGRGGGISIELNEALSRVFALLAIPVDSLRGKRVLYRPTPESDELREALVEATSDPVARGRQALN